MYQRLDWRNRRLESFWLVESSPCVYYRHKGKYLESSPRVLDEMRLVALSRLKATLLPPEFPPFQKAKAQGESHTYIHGLLQKSPWEEMGDGCNSKKISVGGGGKSKFFWYLQTP